MAVRILCTVVLVTLTACGPGSVGELVRADAPSARDALGEEPAQRDCRAIQRARPLVVDWTSQNRLDLELSMKNGVAIVHYGCDGLRLLPACTLAGDYRFVGVSRKEDVVQLTTADEVSANLPLSAVKLSGEVSRDSSLDLALVMVGKKTTTVASASKLMLDGDCAQATHFVRAATIGAFAMDRGSAGKVRAVADLFGAGTSAGSESKRSAGTRDGELSACRKAKSTDAAPRDQCEAALRLELEPLSEEIAGSSSKGSKTSSDEPERSEAATSACPEGLVESNGKCTERQDGEAYLCAPYNAPECRMQCGAGSMESCYNLAKLLAGGKGVQQSYPKAMELSRKACREGAYDACPYFANLVSLCEMKKMGDCPRDEVAPLRLAACEGGHGMSCYQAALDSGKKVAEQEPLLQRACSLGFQSGCTTLGMALVAGRGIDKDIARGLSVLTRACDGGHSGACGMLSFYFKEGREGVPKNLAKALQADEKLCGLGRTRACMDAATAYESAPPGVMRDKDRAIKLWRVACSVGRGRDAGKACARLAVHLRYKPKRTAAEEKESFAALADGCHLAGINCGMVAKAAKRRAYEEDRRRCTEHDSEACARLSLRMLEAGCEQKKQDSLCAELGLRDLPRLRAIRKRHCHQSRDPASAACRALVEAGGVVPPDVAPPKATPARAQGRAR